MSMASPSRRATFDASTALIVFAKPGTLLEHRNLQEGERKEPASHTRPNVQKTAPQRNIVKPASGWRLAPVSYSISFLFLWAGYFCGRVIPWVPGS